MDYQAATDRVYCRGGRNRGKGADVLVWLHFDETGAFVEDGHINFLHRQENASNLVVSPDGRNVYKDFEGGTKVDVYTCDARTGELTYLATVEAGAPGVMPLPPDGRHVYVFGDPGGGPNRGVVLSRDPKDGMLTVVGPVEPAATFSGMGGSAWSRQHRFAFSKDGKSVCFLAPKLLSVA